MFPLDSCGHRPMPTTKVRCPAGPTNSAEFDPPRGPDGSDDRSGRSGRTTGRYNGPRFEASRLHFPITSRFSGRFILAAGEAFRLQRVMDGTAVGLITNITTDALGRTQAILTFTGSDTDQESITAATHRSWTENTG